MPIVEIKNKSVPIYYESSGSGKPIVFIHPPGMGLITFRKQLPLSKHYTTVCIDLRGNGKSGYDNEKITLPLLAQDICEVLEHLDIKQAVICGYSNGGSIALELALSHPNRVSGLILMGGFPEVNTFLLRSEFKLGIVTVRMKGLPFLAKVLGQAHGTDKEYKKEIENYVLKANPEILYQMYVEGLKYNCTNRLSDIRVPVLLIDGTRDFYLHSYQKMLEREIENTTKVFISKARHQIPTKHADEVNRIIQEYMVKLDMHRNA
ncbi:alpha/beta hydrolase [Bacillus luteolus]|uniref:Alpha/beta hydrolase n=1 Tax=Litchfieldia luteola TaxID=682179 RepID=A0ABR9QKF8_9BACI|nr:alpha/beta hydrolase [Cytobacillus luteolus]MBE4908985.1 alpha/beta hydrolase [Cytobacillus luteolus]MBP1941844.1 pimeloyl-ACP methyl ester carboxylesterase [Cytobacillus luteolus]